MKRISHTQLANGKEYQAYITLGDTPTYWLDTDGSGAECCLLLTLDDRAELEAEELIDAPYIGDIERLAGSYAQECGFTHLKVEIRDTMQKVDGVTVWGARLSQLVRPVGRRGRFTSRPKEQ